MLSREDNELLTRVGPGSAMGAALRRFWVIVCRSEALKRDGDPVRIRLFGQNFVAFRASDGRVGIFDEACPHRGASLLLARNEDQALTCIFHGWKFHVSGEVVDVPTEPTARRESFRKKVPLRAYPVREAGTVVWAYLGEGTPPAFPDFEFTHLPDDQVFSRVAYTHCNWLQGVEATIDSSHASILHRSWVQERSREWASFQADSAPVYDLDVTDYGVRAAAIRNFTDGRINVRVTEFVLPFYAFIPFESPRNVIFSMPVDDEWTAQWYIFYNSEGSIAEYMAQHDRRYPGDPNNFYQPKGTFENRWLQDREKLSGHWTGMPGLIYEDFVVEESMGPIVDRTKEYLGSSDALIVRVRRELLKMARDHEARRALAGPPPDLDYAAIRARNTMLAAGANWRTALHYQVS